MTAYKIEESIVDTGRRPFALSQTECQWVSWFSERGAGSYSARQVMEWCFRQQLLDPLRYTNLSLDLRQHLLSEFDWELPAVQSVLHSRDGSDKLLLRTTKGWLFECVLMPSDNRLALCVSCQQGCRMGCSFCQTGKMGFQGNLESGEILAQVIVASRHARERGLSRPISHVVFMGMGEPLDNYDEVVQAARMLLDPRFFGLSRHRVTISTCGIVPAIRRLGQELPVALALSLHSADDAERSRLMPINRRFPLEELKKVLLEYPLAPRDHITFEYLLMENINDSLGHAKKLVRFLHGLRAKVNLIPMNDHPGSPMKASSDEKTKAFQRYLTERSIPAPVRYSRGQDVSAACGQLAAKHQSQVHLPPRAVARQQRQAKTTRASD